MKIVNVDCDFLVVPVEIPVRGTTHDYGILMVTIETDTGIRGLGFAREHDFHSLSVRHLILNDIATFLKQIGDVIDPGFVWHEASYELPRSDYRVTSGIYSRAASAVDQALWDIRGKELNQPVYRLLGGSQPEVEVYATFGLNIYTQEEETEAAKRLVKQGFKNFKLQGAHADRGRAIDVDAKRVKHLRENVGDENRIILDGRNNYSLFAAMELAKKIEPYNMSFFDEPLYAKDPLALKQLKLAVPRLPLAARSRGGNLWDNRDLIISGAIDVIGENVLDQGGFTQSIKVAHMAEAFQLPVVTGGAWHLQNAHLIAAVTNGWMVEYHALAAGVSETIFADPVTPKNGKLRLSDKPGLGLTLNDAAVKEAKERARSAEKNLK
jgi:L-alanine-DL-glutamate epimerase-like enolase superfamily enzyme